MRLTVGLLLSFVLAVSLHSAAYAQGRVATGSLCTLTSHNAVWAGGNMEIIGKSQNERSCRRLCERYGAKYCSLWTNGDCYGGTRTNQDCRGRACGCSSGSCFAMRWDCDYNRPGRAIQAERGRRSIVRDNYGRGSVCAKPDYDAVWAGGNMEIIGKARNERACRRLCEQYGAKYCSLWTNGECYGGTRTDADCQGTACGCSSGNCYKVRWECRRGRSGQGLRAGRNVNRPAMHADLDALTDRLVEENYRRIRVKDVTFVACKRGKRYRITIGVGTRQTRIQGAGRC